MKNMSHWVPEEKRATGHSTEEGEMDKKGSLQGRLSASKLYLEQLWCGLKGIEAYSESKALSTDVCTVCPLT